MKKIILLGVLLFSMICVGCNSIKNNVSYIGTFFTDEEAVPGQYYFIETKSNLKEILKKDVPKEYDDVFFETKSLFVFKNIETSQGNESVIKSYDIKHNDLIVNVQTKKYGEDCAMGYSWFVLELSIEEIKSIETVKIIKNNVKIISGSKKDEKWHFKYIKFEHLSFNGSFIGLNGNEEIVGVFHSEQEVIDTFSKYNISWLDVPFWNKLSDDFYENNVLIIYFSWFNGGNVERTVSSLYLKENKAIINLSQEFEETVEQIVVFYPIILQVNKEEAQNINEVVLEIN